MVLVTGGTGFIGTHLLEKLVSQGKAVRALVRRTAFRACCLQAWRPSTATWQAAPG